MQATLDDITIGMLPEAADVGAPMLLTILYVDPAGRLIHKGSMRGRVATAQHHSLVFQPDGIAEAGVRLELSVVAIVHLSPGGPLTEVAGDVELLASWTITAPDRPPAVFWRRFGRRKGEGAAVAA